MSKISGKSQAAYSRFSAAKIGDPLPGRVPASVVGENDLPSHTGRLQDRYKVPIQLIEVLLLIEARDGNQAFLLSIGHVSASALRRDCR